MKKPAPAYDITDISALQQRFGTVKEPSLLKELDHVDPNYAPRCTELLAGPGLGQRAAGSQG